MPAILLAHPYLAVGLALSFVVAVLAFVLVVATRYQPQHRGHDRSTAVGYQPRRAAQGHRHRIAPQDELTVEIRHRAVAA